jgi:hypothetical protein
VVCCTAVARVHKVLCAASHSGEGRHSAGSAPAPVICSCPVLRAPGLALLVLALPASLGYNQRLESEARTLGGRLGSTLAALAAYTEDRKDARPPAEVPDILSSAGGALDEGVPRFVGKSHGKASRGPRSPGAKSRSGVFIGANTVLRLAASGVVPEGRPVDASGGRPAGIQLSGVSALGVGVHDGDVLTEVAGRPVRTEGQVVGMVLALRARRESSISAAFYRGSERWSLVVEMPYPPGS